MMMLDKWEDAEIEGTDELKYGSVDRQRLK